MTADSILGICLMLAFSSPPVADGLSDECPSSCCPEHETLADAHKSHPDLLAPRNVLGPSDPTALPEPPKPNRRYGGYVFRKDFELELLNDPSLDDVGGDLGNGEVFVTPETDILSEDGSRTAVEARRLFVFQHKPRSKPFQRAPALPLFSGRPDLAGEH